MPRTYDQGNYFKVTVSAKEVASWRKVWPCSGLSDDGFFCKFDKKTGDLVDTSTHGDGGGATPAIIEDAQAWGEAQLGICTPGQKSKEWPWGQPKRKERVLYTVEAYEMNDPEARPDIAVNLPFKEAKAYAKDYWARNGPKRGGPELSMYVINQDTGAVSYAILPRKK